MKISASADISSDLESGSSDGESRSSDRESGSSEMESSSSAENVCLDLQEKACKTYMKVSTLQDVHIQEPEPEMRC